MLKIVYMGTPEIASTILRSLVDAKVSPSFVITQTSKPQGRGHKVEPSHVSKTAQQLGIEVIETDNVNDGAAFTRLKELKPDLILVVAFGQLLKENVLQLPKIACLNVHASLLPKYRGAAPVQRAIWNGDAVTGVTIQKMVRKLDAGDVLLSKETPIGKEETSGELLVRLARLGAEGLIESVRLLESGKFKFVPQDESKVTIAAKISKEEAKIDWGKPAEYIYNQIRALQPWPVAETLLFERRVKIFKAEIVTTSKPGIDTDKKSFVTVQCGNAAALSIQILQPENKKRMSISEFLRGLNPG